MVAAVAAPTASANENNRDAAVDFVDDDSLEGAYGMDNTTASDTAPAPPPEADANDDYAKSFDSPVEPGQGDGQNGQLHNVPLSSPSMPPPDSSHISLPLESVSATNGPPPAAGSTVASPQAHSGQPPDASPPATASRQSQKPLHQAGSELAPESAVESGSVAADSPGSSVDLQKLVADLTAQPTTSSSTPVATQSKQAVDVVPLNSSASLPSSSSLPPRPPQPDTQSYSSQHLPSAASSNASMPNGNLVPSTSGHPPAAIASTEAMVIAPTFAAVPSATPASRSMNAVACPPQTAPGYPVNGASNTEYENQWDRFVADERQYMSDAKWDRFPEGSRLFIGNFALVSLERLQHTLDHRLMCFSVTGNLSSDKVSKRDVFEVFHKFGRLAQISLKSAYGFVQYHDVEEGRRAMEHLQGIEIKGRRIHLEVSRVQEKSKKDRGRSPDRARGRDSGRRGDKHHGGRDDYRPGRNHSPRRHDHHHGRDGGPSRDRAFHDGGRGARGRSRSPGYGRNDQDSYRRRSPSPYGRSRQEVEVDLPHRFGSEVPDVQIILQPDVSRDFGAWVQDAFNAKGLRTEVMYLHPRFSRDHVIQRQAAEGVHGVVDLDAHAQSVGRIPVQAFKRSVESGKVRFDQYVNLDPNTAAEVILRAKSVAAAPYGQGYAPGAGYGASYNGAVQQHPINYGTNPYAASQHQQQPHQQQQQPPPQHQQQQSHQQQSHAQQQHQQPVAPSAADIAGLMGQLDNATLQRLLTSIQGSGPSHGQGGVAAVPGGYGVPAVAQTATSPQVDIQTILGSLGGNASSTHHHGASHASYGTTYGAQSSVASNAGVNAPSGGQDTTAQVQHIMAHLSRFR
ncbi:hypothetical protein CDD82_5613 [Ophiocordyceps australis]|uniref:RRM domain-containing protein n=1 Tax=Ophiocordyceps australis TaxID=1399860 RepID=A0A2C5YWQ7_9HYPO|nr:hypothetical protein CDD82_5613 [Ophiocordyceps australis]